MRKFLLFCNIIFFHCSFAQTEDYLRVYEEFGLQVRQEYEDFRIKVSKDYAEFIRHTWEQYKALPATPIPKEEQVPPIVIKDEDREKPIHDRPVIIEDEIILPEPTPQPRPISPIREQPENDKEYLHFVLYGTDMKVRLSNNQKFKLKSLEIDCIADTWEQLAGEEYNNVIKDCLGLRIRHQLCDWSYLRMLDTLCSTFLGQDTNEAELLKAYLYCQSGYQMRLAFANNHLYMLYASQHFIYEKPCWQIDGTLYYADNCSFDEINICGATFPNEQALSLYISEEQELSRKKTKERVLQSKDVDWLSLIVSEDENLIAFYSEYPSSCVGEDVMTRWAIYANAPLSREVRQKLYPQFKTMLMNRHAAESVDIICHWIQTAFVYEYDDKVWGRDRAFFADETLYYPYCDCEDRSILLTRLVRDLLNLKCALVYYPGHLATAIAVGEEVKGDYIRINGTKFLICDPTYIGAPIGKTMPDMDNKTAKVIVLN